MALRNVGDVYVSRRNRFYIRGPNGNLKHVSPHSLTYKEIKEAKNFPRIKRDEKGDHQAREDERDSDLANRISTIVGGLPDETDRGN